MSNINFTLLETARLLRQKTQKEVVEAIGISQASLSKAEHGLQELPIDIMSKLYDYYDFPETFFFYSFHTASQSRRIQRSCHIF